MAGRISLDLLSVADIMYGVERETDRPRVSPERLVDYSHYASRVASCRLVALKIFPAWVVLQRMRLAPLFH